MTQSLCKLRDSTKAWSHYDQYTSPPWVLTIELQSPLSMPQLFKDGQTLENPEFLNIFLSKYEEFLCQRARMVLLQCLRVSSSEDSP